MKKTNSGGDSYDSNLKGTASNNHHSTSNNTEVKTTPPEDSNRVKTALPEDNIEVVSNITDVLKPRSPHRMIQKKLTFDRVDRQSVRDNIAKFQKLQRGGMCVMGSGRCAEHNVRLVRSVTNKKVSVIDENGYTRWVTREVTILTCPGSVVSLPVVASDVDSKISDEQGNTNKKQRLFPKNGMDQPREEGPMKKDNNDILLDETK